MTNTSVIITLSHHLTPQLGSTKYSNQMSFVFLSYSKGALSDHE